MNVLVCCSTGMSSSIVVKMLREASQQQGLHYRFLALSTSQIGMSLAEADIILVAPQNAQEADAIRAMQDAKGKPVIVLGREEYGNGDSRSILKKIRNCADIRENSMDQSSNFLEKHLMPVVVKIGGNRALTVIRNAMCACMALLIIGSASILLSNIPYAPLAHFMAPAAPFFNTIFNATTGMMGVLTAVSIAYYGALEYKQDIFVSIATSLSLFIVSQYHLVGDDYQLNIDGLGTPGLISAILIGFVTLKTLALFKQKNIGIKMPDGVPEAVSESFTSLLPALFLLALFSLLVVVFHFNINAIITRIMTPVTWILNSAPGYALYHMLCALVFFCGINSQVVIGVAMPFLMQNGALNERAFQAGEQVLFAATNATDAMVWAGGTGATLGLVVLMALTAKSQYFKKLGRMSVGPGIFNINEPIIFGTPICFNALFMAPFILTPGLIAGATYLLMQYGIIDLPHVANLPWTTPTFIVGFLMTGGSLSTTAWSFAIIVISMLIYYPFFRIADKQFYRMEQQAEVAQSEEIA